MENNIPQGMHPNMPQPPMQPAPIHPAPNPNMVPNKPPTSGLAITGLVLGIVSILISFVPLINNLAFILAILGIIFAIIGIVGTSKGKKSGKGIAIAALIINVLAFVIVLATQALFSAALDSAVNGSQPVQATVTDTQSGQSVSSAAAGSNLGTQDYSNMPIGSTVELDSGLAVTVNAVAEVQDYSGDAYSKVNVTYVNNGNKEASFNIFDWSGEDAQGAQRSATYIVTDDGVVDTLNSGKLASGGTVTGDIYFEGAVAKVLYSSSVFAQSAAATWVV